MKQVQGQRPNLPQSFRRGQGLFQRFIESHGMHAFVGMGEPPRIFSLLG
jgi:hypothetical protein